MPLHRSTRSILNARPNRTTTAFDTERERLVTALCHRDPIVETQTPTLFEKPTRTLRQLKPAGGTTVDRVEYSQPINPGIFHLQGLRR